MMLVGQVSFSQSKKDEAKMAKQAMSYFQAGQYSDAFPLYSQLVALSPMSADYAYHFGICAIYNDADKTNAIKYLKQAEKSGYSDVELFYYLGKAYHLSYQFSEASGYYEKFLDNAKDKQLEKYDALREIQMCIYATKIMKHPKELVVKKKADADQQGFFRLMNLEAVGGKIITTPNELLNPKDKKSTNPHLVYLNGTPKVIYFSSFSDSSGLDIWQADLKTDGSYGTPIRVPGLVNSMYDEDYPFFHPNGKSLYFSSRGHNSMGGYDIFRSDLDSLTNKWKKPVNLGFAFNSPDDDLFFICDAANQSAIFASNRTTDDTHYSLYQTSFEGKDLEIIYAKSSFFSGLNPDNASAQIVVKDLETGEIIGDVSADNKTGKFDVYFPKPGRYSYTITVPDQEEKFTTEFDVQPGRSGSVYFPQQVNLTTDAQGKTALVVRNGADAMLDNSMENAFAGLLRSKAPLDVSKTEADPSNLERSMTNAPALAGFSKGKSAQDILSDMKNEIQSLNNAKPLIDNQKKLAYQLARQQYQLAKKAYASSDSIAKSINDKVESAKAKGTPYIFNDQDKAALEKSLELRKAADQMRIKADAALLLGDQYTAYQASIDPTLKELNAQSSKLQAYIKENNVDGTVEVLTQERKRLLAEQSRPKKPSNAIPQNAKATAKAHDANAKAYDEMLNDLFVLEAKAIEDKKNSSPSLAQTQAAAKDKKTALLTMDPKVKKTFDDAAAAKKASELYAKINASEDLGLSEMDKKDIPNSEVMELKGNLQSLETKSSEPYAYTLLFDQAKIAPYRNYNLDEKEQELPLNLPAASAPIDNSTAIASDNKSSKVQDSQPKDTRADNQQKKTETVAPKNPEANIQDNPDITLALKSSKVMKQVIDSANFKEYDFRYAVEEWKFYDLMKKYPEISGTFKDRAKADSVNKAIADTERLLSSETDPTKKQSLQKKLTTLENQRAKVEVANKDIFRAVAKKELDAERDKALKNYSLSADKFKKEPLLDGFIKQLKNDADSIADLALIERKKIETVTDINEKDKLIRSAFSKEMMAAAMYKHLNKAIDALAIFELYSSADENFLLSATSDEIRARYSTHSVKTTVPPATESIATTENTSKEIPEELSPDLMKDLQSLNLTAEDMQKSGIQMETKQYTDSEVNKLLGPRPERIDKPFFVKINKSAYGANYPIPVDEPMPMGIIYSVQVGAFKNPIPNNTFSQFAPVMGQKVGNGFTRYMAGLFNVKGDATKARDEIRAMGYQDAFVVVYKDGKRISGGTTANAVPAVTETTPVASNNQQKNTAEISNLNPSSNDENAFTIQIGVLGRPAIDGELKAPNLTMYYIADKNLYKYGSGKYPSKSAAAADLNKIKALGYADAFVTKYFSSGAAPLSGEGAAGFDPKPLNEIQNLSGTDNKKVENKNTTSPTEEEDPDKIYEFKLSEMYGIYNCCEENSSECNNPDMKSAIKRFTLISNGSGVAIDGFNKTINFQWKFVKDSDTPIQGMEEILGQNYSFFYRKGIIHLGKYCKNKN
jgi:hypothetical protein